MSRPAFGPSREARPKNGELADVGERGGQVVGAEEGRVGRAGGRQERGDRHDREAGVAQGGPGGLGDRGLAVANCLVDHDGSEDTDRDQHVRHRDEPECEDRRPRKLPLGIAEAAHVKVMTPKPRNAKNVSAMLATMSANEG
jgi:hypothetical protein